MLLHQTISHLVFSNPVETFIGIEDEFGRLPLSHLGRDGARIEWLRADGCLECIDLRGSPSEETVLRSFDSTEGLILAIYPDLGATDLAHSEPTFLIISCEGVIEDDPQDQDLFQPAIQATPILPPQLATRYTS